MFALCASYIILLELAVQVFPQVFAGLFLQDKTLIRLAAKSVRMYTIALPGVAVQYALVDGLTAMGKVKYALPLSLFRKIVYAVCLGVLPLLWNIENIFYAGTISDIIGALFSLILFWGVINSKLKKELCFQNTTD